MTNKTFLEKEILKSMTRDKMEAEEIGQNISLTRDSLYKTLLKLWNRKDVEREEEYSPCTRNCKECDGDLACSNSRKHVLWTITAKGRKRIQA